jgi:hypothetical protein
MENMYTKIKKSILLLSILTVSSNCYSDDQYSYISGYGKSFSEARNAASKITVSQGLKIVGQNYYQTRNGDWTVTLKTKIIR